MKREIYFRNILYPFLSNQPERNIGLIPTLRAFNKSSNEKILETPLHEMTS